MKKTVLYILFLLTVSTVYGQKKIKGIVYDSDNNEPILFANLFDKNRNYGTSSSTNGTFTITLPDSIKSGTLEVSCIGYQPTKVNYTTNSKYLKIGLKVKKYVLNEVIVKSKYIKPLKLLKRAIRQIPEIFCNKQQTIYRQMKISHYKQDSLIFDESYGVKSIEPAYEKHFFDAYKAIVEKVKAQKTTKFIDKSIKNLRMERFVDIFEQPLDIFKKNPCRYYNYSMNKFRNYRYKYLEEKEVAGEMCYVIEATLRDSVFRYDTKYLRRDIFYINRDDLHFMKYKNTVYLHDNEGLNSLDTYTITFQKTENGYIAKDYLFNGYILQPISKTKDLKISSHLQFKLLNL